VGIRIGFGLRPIGLLLLLHCFDDNSVSGQKVRDDGRVTASRLRHRWRSKLHNLSPWSSQKKLT